MTGLGAGLRELLFGDQPVIAGYDADELPPGGTDQLLTPWPNRIDGGRYAFGGTEFQLALTEPEHMNAIHGLTRWAAWTPVRHDADAVVLRADPHGQQGYPFCLQIDAEYRLDPDGGLRVAVTAANRGSHAAPYGTGSHPYLTAGTPVVDDCELTVPAAFWLPTDERGIPSGNPAAVEGTPYDFRQPRTIGATRLDHALTGLARDRDGRAWAHLAANCGPGTRVGLWAGQGYRWLQAFTGDPLPPDRRRKAVAIEPGPARRTPWSPAATRSSSSPARPSHTPGASRCSTTGGDGAASKGVRGASTAVRPRGLARRVKLVRV